MPRNFRDNIAVAVILNLIFAPLSHGLKYRHQIWSIGRKSGPSRGHRIMAVIQFW